MPGRLLLILILLGVIRTTADGGNWPNWRGPNQNGVAAGEGYPVSWGEDQAIAWKAAVPGWGTSTPVIWGDRIFLTADDEEKNALICFNREGERLWTTYFGATAGSKNRKASGSNPSAVTDGEHVYAYFRSGDVGCVDMEGQLVWSFNLQQEYGSDQLWWDLGTSPVLTSKALVVAVLHQGPSYVVALDKESGKVVWKSDRQSDAPAESRDSYTTPIVIDEEGRETVIVLGADCVTAHDATDGKEVWRVKDLNPEQRGNYRSIASAAVIGDLLIAPYCRGNTLTAIRLGTGGQVVWSIETTGPDVPTPTAHDGKVYLCSDRGQVTCIDAATGQEQWVEELPQSRYPFSASPVIADGHLYLTRENGRTYVLKLGEQPELVASNFIRENTFATPVFVDGLIFLRTSGFLFRIENP